MHCSRKSNQCPKRYDMKTSPDYSRVWASPVFLTLLEKKRPAPSSTKDKKTSPKFNNLQLSNSVDCFFLSLPPLTFCRRPHVSTSVLNGCSWFCHFCVIFHVQSRQCRPALRPAAANRFSCTMVVSKMAADLCPEGAWGVASRPVDQVD